MASKFAEGTSRSFDPMSAAGLSDEARKAVTAAFDAMSNWRTETASNNEKNFERVLDKMAAAARALGWPEQIVDSTRAQMQGITKMQTQALDQVMDAWEEQIKSPNPSAMLSKLKSLPSFGQAGNWPNAGDFQTAVSNPFQAYMQLAQQWQKAWTDGMSMWTHNRHYST